MRIAFLLRSLNVGGTERQLVNLANGLNRRGHAVTVLVFYSGGAFTQELVDAGVPVIDLKKSGRWDLLRFALRLRRELASIAPDVLYGLLPAPNLFTTVALSLIRRRPRIVWGIRSAGMDLSHYEAVNRVIYGAEMHLSFLADRVVANSFAAQKAWLSVRKIDVIPNGIDTERFDIDLDARKRVRGELGLSNETVLITNVGRLDPIKDHATFVRAAAVVSRAQPHARFAVAGGGDPAYTARIVSLASDLGVAGRFHWLGPWSDTPGLYNASDLFVSSSSSEAFPNVVAEAMACGLPCVVTDAGDSRVIVSNDEAVVRPGDPEALASAIIRILKSGRTSPLETRQQIVSRFSVDAMVGRTEAFLEELRRDGQRSKRRTR